MRFIDTMTSGQIDVLKFKGMLSEGRALSGKRIKMHDGWISLIDNLLGPHGIAAFGGGKEIVRRFNASAESEQAK